MQSCSGMYPVSVLIRSPLVVTSWPSVAAWPLVGGSRPSRILISVDLPAPFAPTSPVIPGGTATVRLSSAVTSRVYCLVSASVWMTAAAVPASAGPGPVRTGSDAVTVIFASPSRNCPGHTLVQQSQHAGRDAPASSSSGLDFGCTPAARLNANASWSLRLRDDAVGRTASYRDQVSGDPAVPPATALGTRPRRRLGTRVWATLDWVTAALCALIIYSALFKGQVIYRVPLVSWDARAWLPPLLAVGLSLPVAIRRRDPLLALALVLAGCVITMAFGGEINRGPFLPLALVLFLVASKCARTIAIAALAVSLWLLAAQALILHWTGIGPGDAVGTALVLIIVWMTGWAVQQRRAYAARLREYVFDQDPGEARAALGAIQRVTREALADMQRLLGVLRQSETTQDGAGQDAAGPPSTSQRGDGRERTLQLA